MFKPVPRRFLSSLLIALLALSVVASGCALSTRSKAVKLAVTLEQTLGTLQDAVRHVCNPTVAFPTPITDCTAESAALGLTTVKFRQISAAEAKAFTFMHDTLEPALRTWQKNSPAPTEFAQFAALVNDLVAVVRTVATSPKLQPVFDTVSVVLAAVAALGQRVGVQ